MMALLVIIWTFSTRQMREYFYNSFLGVHHLFLVFFIMMYYHPVRYLCVPPTMLRSLSRLFQPHHKVSGECDKLACSVRRNGVAEYDASRAFPEKVLPREADLHGGKEERNLYTAFGR